MPWGSTHWSPMKLPALNENTQVYVCWGATYRLPKVSRLWARSWSCDDAHLSRVPEKKIINHKVTTAKFSFLPSNFIVPLWNFRDFQQNCDLRSLHISPFHISCTGACLSYSMLERVNGCCFWCWCYCSTALLNGNMFGRRARNVAWSFGGRNKRLNHFKVASLLAVQMGTGSCCAL